MLGKRTVSNAHTKETLSVTQDFLYWWAIMRIYGLKVQTQLCIGNFPHHLLHYLMWTLVCVSNTEFRRFFTGRQMTGIWQDVSIFCCEETQGKKNLKSNSGFCSYVTFICLIPPLSPRKEKTEIQKKKILTPSVTISDEFIIWFMQQETTEKRCILLVLETVGHLPQSVT